MSSTYENSLHLVNYELFEIDTVIPIIILVQGTQIPFLYATYKNHSGFEATNKLAGGIDHDI